MAVFAASQAATLLLVGVGMFALLPQGASQGARQMLGVRLAYAASPSALLAAGLIGARIRARGGVGGLWGRVRAGSLLSGAGAGVLLKLVGDAVAAAEAPLLGPLRGNNPLQLYPHAFAGAGARALLAVAVVLVAPAGEETFFRGLLFGWLRRRLPLAAAVALTAAAFGLAHVQVSSGAALAQGLALALPLAVIGAGLCILYEVSGTLWVPAAAHALVNASSLALALLLH